MKRRHHQVLGAVAISFLVAACSRTVEAVPQPGRTPTPEASETPVLPAEIDQAISTFCGHLKDLSDTLIEVEADPDSVSREVADRMTALSNGLAEDASQLAASGHQPLAATARAAGVALAALAPYVASNIVLGEVVQAAVQGINDALASLPVDACPTS